MRNGRVMIINPREEEKSGYEGVKLKVDWEGALLKGSKLGPLECLVGKYTSNECDPERHPKNEREAQGVNTIEIEEIEECVECQAVWRHVVR